MLEENARRPCLPLILAIWPAPPGYVSQYFITIGYSLLLTDILLTTYKVISDLFDINRICTYALQIVSFVKLQVNIKMCTW